MPYPCNPSGKALKESYERASRCSNDGLTCVARGPRHAHDTTALIRRDLDVDDGKKSLPQPRGSACVYNYDMSQYTIRYKSNNNVVYSCKYHVVWCPKYQHPVLGTNVDARLKEIIQCVYTESRAEILKLEVMPAHVHLLMDVDLQYGIHRLVRAIKGCSSRPLRHEFPWLKSRLPTLWTNSYFVSMVGGAPLEAVQQYIENQKRV
jgi:REP-associated tyrosine transposase